MYRIKQEGDASPPRDGGSNRPQMRITYNGDEHTIRLPTHVDDLLLLRRCRCAGIVMEVEITADEVHRRGGGKISRRGELSAKLNWQACVSRDYENF